MKKKLRRAVRSFTNMVMGVAAGFLPDPEDMKPERIQFWADLLGKGWRVLGGDEALERTLVCADESEASKLCRAMKERCADLDYEPDALVIEGNEVYVLLTTPEKGRVTKRDFAAAVAIDACH